MNSEKLDQLAIALCAVQKELRPAKKNSRNPHFNSTFADLESDWEAARDLLSKNGLCVIQRGAHVEKGDFVLVTTLLHISGQYISGNYWIAPEKPGPQALKSAWTYARRCGLEGILGLTSDDDDGNAASNGGTNVDRAPARQPNQSEPNSNQPVGSKEIVFGKFAGKTFDSVGVADVRNYVEWLSKQKDLSYPAKRFIKEGLEWLAQQ